jgi:hypothetical protein
MWFHVSRLVEGCHTLWVDNQSGSLSTFPFSNCNGRLIAFGLSVSGRVLHHLRNKSLSRFPLAQPERSRSAVSCCHNAGRTLRSPYPCPWSCHFYQNCFILTRTCEAHISWLRRVHMLELSSSRCQCPHWIEPLVLPMASSSLHSCMTRRSGDCKLVRKNGPSLLHPRCPHHFIEECINLHLIIPPLDVSRALARITTMCCHVVGSDPITAMAHGDQHEQACRSLQCFSPLIRLFIKLSARAVRWTFTKLQPESTDVA